MNRRLLLLFIALGYINTSFAQKSKKESYTVNEQQIAETLRFLSSDDLQGRNSGSEGIEKAALFLEDVFTKNSVKPYFITYRDTLSNFDKPAYNIVGYLEGNDPKLKDEYVIIGAHYDHIGMATAIQNGDTVYNGADDNASGTTAVTELVKYFAKTKANKRSILFCFFSAEEKGLLGSYHLAGKLKQANFIPYVMLNFEMIGVPLGMDIEAYVTGYSRSNITEKMNEYAGAKLFGYTDFAVKYQLFKASDNYPFYLEMNIPAHTVCTTNMNTFQYYHHLDDEFENMDTAHMASFMQKMLPVVTKMINAKTHEIALKK
ncbi:M28 family peptidase [Flavobacterium salilacus subsp. salilacus]|uniref:M20/M25/M40 family metallo-hydrolase n=1 Tax=Flavobacterium TaxID=237 RepID=UPI0010752881|nr:MULTISPECIES: M20/M25/M40 family metallo-hydrolase [Flavobacterium]KAF2519619.1 M28 family peptidase [Flavobacterium salilacus subsp. salilacus]MBE1614479.1 M28 family peptidase [Flavobacterium sp. SaA2.13]